MTGAYETCVQGRQVLSPAGAAWGGGKGGGPEPPRPGPSQDPPPSQEEVPEPLEVLCK